MSASFCRKMPTTAPGKGQKEGDEKDDGNDAVSVHGSSSPVRMRTAAEASKSPAAGGTKAAEEGGRAAVF